MQKIRLGSSTWREPLQHTFKGRDSSGLVLFGPWRNPQRSITKISVILEWQKHSTSISWYKRRNIRIYTYTYIYLGHILLGLWRKSWFWESGLFVLQAAYIAVMRNCSSSNREWFESILDVYRGPNTVLQVKERILREIFLPTLSFLSSLLFFP